MYVKKFLIYTGFLTLVLTVVLLIQSDCPLKLDKKLGRPRWPILKVHIFHVVPVKSKVKISQNFVAFSEYMNFKQQYKLKETNSSIFFFKRNNVGSETNE